MIAALALAVPAMAGAQQQRQDQDKVTGGGQVFVDTADPVRGPGDTVGFVAIATAPEGAARGQFTRVETSAAGRTMERFHGVVSCLEVEGDTARFGGHERRTAQAFTVDVDDNGPQDADIVYFRTTDEPCEDDEDPEEDHVLARGNATVHNGG